MANEAKVKISVDGAAEAERKVKKLNDTFKSFGKEIGNLFSGAVRDFGRIGTSLAQIDPVRAADKFRDYRRTITEFSLASQRSIGDLKNSFAGMSNTTLLPDEQVADFASSLAQATYDFGDSRQAIEALRGSGVELGRSFEQMAPIGEALHNSLGTSLNDIPSALGTIEAAANSLGTVGGPAALQDQLVALGTSLDSLSVKGSKDFGELINVLNALGKGLRPEQAKKVQGELVGIFNQGGESLRHNLHIKEKDFYDEQGNIKVNSANVEKYRNYLLKNTGSVAGAKHLLRFKSPQLAAALFRPDFVSDLKKEEGAEADEAKSGKTGAQTALDDYGNSDAGKSEKAKLERDRREREDLGSSVDSIQQGVADKLSSNPMTRYMEMTFGGAAAGSVVNSAVTKMFGGIGSKLASSFMQVEEAAGKASAKLTTLGQIGKLGAAAGVGVLAYEVTKALDDYFGVTDKWYASTDKGKQDKYIEDEGVKKNKALLDYKKQERTEQIKGYEAKGKTHGEAVYAAEHPAVAGARDLLSGAMKPPPVEVNVTVTSDTSSPLRVVDVRKGRAGAQ